MPELSDAKIQLEPIVCKTVVIMPSAISSRDALLRALPKSEAVACLGRPGNAFGLISPIRTSIFDKSPPIASETT